MKIVLILIRPLDIRPQTINNIKKSLISKYLMSLKNIYNASITTAEAPPPPLHKEAAP